MTKFRGLVSASLITVFAAGMLTMTGCSGVSEEEMAQLNSLRKEVSSLESDMNALKSEKTKLEREIGEKNAKLEQCAKDKAATKANLEKLPK